MATIPAERYISEMILTSAVTWLTQKLATEIDDADAAKAQLVKIGPRQQDPVSVGLFLFENDLEDPKNWPHAQDVLLSVGTGRRTSGLQGARISGQLVARQTIGDDFSWEYQRAITILQEVWLDKVSGVSQTEENLTVLSGIVAGRVRRALKDGGFHFGTGQSLVDDYGELTVDGPFFGEEYAVRQVGKQMFTSRYLRVWYRTSES